MSYYYVYYSYEEWGRGYIGRRCCECLPEEDLNYFGSFRDKSFKPVEKVILKVCETLEESCDLECKLHEFFRVDLNPHFANRARQTSKKFFCSRKGKEAVFYGVKGESHPCWGRKRTQEEKDRISRSKKGKPRKDIIGEKHHMNRPEVREKVSGTNAVLYGVTGDNHPCGGTKWFVNSGGKCVRRKESPGPEWMPGRKWTQASSTPVQ